MKIENKIRKKIKTISLLTGEYPKEIPTFSSQTTAHYSHTRHARSGSIRRNQFVFAKL